MHSLYDGTHRHAIREADRVQFSCAVRNALIVRWHTQARHTRSRSPSSSTQKSTQLPRPSRPRPDSTPPRHSSAPPGGARRRPGARPISPDLPPDLPRSPHVGGRRSARAPGCSASGPSRRARGGGRVSARFRERTAPARRLIVCRRGPAPIFQREVSGFSFLLFSVLGRAGALHAARRRRQPAAEEGEGAQWSSPPSGAN